MKKIISSVLLLSMLFSSASGLAASYTDTQGHWAEEQISIWSDYGVISGYNGEFSPNRSITRGEFAVVLNRLMKYEKTTENKFADLGQDFYTDSILKLYEAGVMQGYENKISPKDSLTREEAAIMICRALGIEPQETVNKNFSDYGDVSSWAKEYINAAVNLGLLNGAAGKLNPKNTITRAEVITILNNAVFPVVSEGQDVVRGFDISNIIVISVGNTTIENCGINGKIIITQGVTDGTITFKDSEINGEVVIDNEREGFIKLENTTVADEKILENEAFVSEKEEEKDDDDDDSGSSGGPGGGGPSGKNDKDDEDDEPVLDADYYLEINAEMVTNLEAAVADVSLFLDHEDPERYSVFTNDEKYALNIVKTCIEETLTYKDKAVIDTAFVKATFPDQVEEVLGIYDSMEADGTSGAFLEKLAINLEFSTLEWLANAFGILEEDL